MTYQPPAPQTVPCPGCGIARTYYEREIGYAVESWLAQADCPQCGRAYSLATMQSRAYWGRAPQARPVIDGQPLKKTLAPADMEAWTEILSAIFPGAKIEQVMEVI